jgi:ABC-type dipeptide/oligopeptide/nickel transport system ATPase component
MSMVFWGMKQRFGIAQLLLNNPKLIIVMNLQLV